MIGAGLGGLSAATYLAAQGKKVLLLERRNIPGGYATSFVRGRFEFEVSLHELSGIGKPGRRAKLFNYLESIGLTDKVEFAPIENVYRSIFPDLDITLPCGRDAFEQTLVEAFPREREGISTFLKRIDDLAEEVKPFQTTGARRPPPWKAKSLLRFFPATWSQVLDRDVQDPIARAVLSQLWGYFGLGPSECSFLYFALGLQSLVTNGAHYIKGRSQHLANAFVNLFFEWGGEVKFSSTVRKISLSDQKVTGVITDQEEQFTADYVVSNLNPISTANDLIGRDLLPASFFRNLGFRRPAPSSFNIYLGLSKPPEELGLTEHEVFINDSYDLDSQAAQMDTLDNPSSIIVTTYNSAWKPISPPDTTMSVVTALMHGEPWCGIGPHDYQEIKHSLADHMMTIAERSLSPSLRESIEELSVSTPVTNMRYANSLAGSIYGSSPHPGDSTILRVPHKGPLDGLYFVGAWTSPGGGFEPSMLGGKAVGEALVEAMNRVGNGKKRLYV